MKTFDEALAVHLARYDRLQAELRAMLADPEFVNDTAGPYTCVMADLINEIKDIWKLKNAVEGAKWALKQEQKAARGSAGS